MHYLIKHPVVRSLKMQVNNILTCAVTILLLCCGCGCDPGSSSSEIDQSITLLNLIRPRRQFFYDSGVQGTANGRRTLFDWNGRRVEGYGQVSRTWDLRQPTVFKGGFDGTSDRGTYNLGSGYQRDRGLNFGSNGRYNLYKNDQMTVDAYAGYDRTFGPATSSNRGIGLDIQRTVF